MRQKLPSLKCLRAFELAAELTSFTRAAAQLSVTQGAVSRAVSRLERELGVSLFVREARALHLTAAGKKLWRELDRSFSRIEAVCGEIAHGGTAAELRIGVVPSLATFWLVPRLSRFASEHPDITVTILPEYRALNVDQEELDLMLRYGYHRRQHKGATQISVERLFPVSSPAFAEREAKRTKTAKALLEFPLILSRFPTDWEVWLKARKLGLAAARKVHQLFDYSLAVQAAVEGRGVLMARSLLVREQLASGQLVRIAREAGETPAGYYAIVARSSASSAGVRRFLDWLTRQFRESREQTR